MSTTTVLPFAGGELSSFDPLDGGCIEITNAGTFNPAHARCSINVGGIATGFNSPTWAAASDFWFHEVLNVPAADNNFFGDRVSLALLNAGVNVLQMLTHSNNDTASCNLIFQTLQAGVMTTVGTLTVSGGLQTIDINLVSGAGGSCTVYVAGTQRLAVTGLDHAGFTGVDQMFGGPTGPITGLGFGALQHSEIICDTVSRVGCSLITVAEDTVSAFNTGFSGDVGNINEVVLDDSHSVISDAPDQVSTYYKNAANFGTLNVVAVCVGVRAQMTAGSSTNLQVALRTNGTNYFGPTSALDFGFQAVSASWENNPFTAAPWDTVTAAAVEVGMKSIA